MNFLAHLYLAGNDPEAIVGSLAADFLDGGDLSAFTPGVREGIRRHRAIDAFTDEHPRVRQSVARLAPAHRHCAAILVDVFYDHFLARQWPKHSREPLDAFAARMHAALAEKKDLAPPRMRAKLGALVEQRWLVSYAEVDGIARALERLGKRFRKPVPLERATEDLELHRTELEADFDAFFPDLRAAFLAETPA